MARPRELSKRRLEVQLAKLKVLEDPSLKLEQYPVSPEVAAELLFMAGFEHNDLVGRVADLGTGTGRLAIGAALMGAESAVGVDVDKRAISLAEENGREAKVDVDWLVSDLNGVHGPFDTVVMNPPYGTRVVHSDTRFLYRAAELASTVYSIHKTSTRTYILRFAGRRGWKVDGARSLRMVIPHLFEFHRKPRKTVDVDLYRIRTANSP